MEFTNHLQPSEESEKSDGRRRLPRLGLTSQILLALVLGLACGAVLHYAVPAGAVRDDVLIGGVFYLVGQGFIRLMQMLVVPLVFCSIVCGAAAIDTKTLGSVGLKTLLLYLLTTATAISLALGRYFNFMIVSDD